MKIYHLSNVTGFEEFGIAESEVVPAKDGTKYRVVPGGSGPWERPPRVYLKPEDCATTIEGAKALAVERMRAEIAQRKEALRLMVEEIAKLEETIATGYVYFEPTGSFV